VWDNRAQDGRRRKRELDEKNEDDCGKEIKERKEKDGGDIKMRFVAEYALPGINELPLDYHNGFVSLIKEAFITDDEKVFHDLFDDRLVKPYTFSVRFLEKPQIKSGNVRFKEGLKFFFSSASREIGTRVYNGLVSIKKFRVYSILLSNPQISLLPEPKIMDSNAVYRTLSPILIRHYKKENYYTLPNEDGFQESMSEAIKEQWRHLVDEKSECPDTKIEVLWSKKVVARNYGVSMYGFTGTIRVKSSPQLLNLFLQSGIGQRRSQGFGMLEVVA